MTNVMVLTVAALAAQAFLKTRSSVHARLITRGHDLVGIGFGADLKIKNKIKKNVCLIFRFFFK